MTSFKFYKFSPGGNATVFLMGNPPAETSHFCREALGENGVGGEQAGFVNLETNTLTMAGGEFCVNACRALAALLALQNPAQRHWEATITGFTGHIALQAEGCAPRWLASATFSIPQMQLSENQVNFPGITHIYKQSDAFPDPAAARSAGSAILKNRNLHVMPAAGHIWWRKCQNLYEILPFVITPLAGTAMLESSCGSASLGLAALLGESCCRILQPSGAILEVCHDGEKFSVTGCVNLVCAGDIWLKDPEQ